MADDRIAALLKRAAGGEDGQDATFEQSMSDIADIVLKDKAPSLSKYEVGFQLIDRDDDGDSRRAVGVKVFKVGKAWLYVPIFFLNGEVKGTELLYLKNQDVFVPLQEGWIRQVFTRQSEPIGRGVDRSVASREGSRPNLSRLVRPPAKYAADMSEAVRSLAREVLPSWSASLASDPLASVQASLPAFLKAAGRPAVLALGALLAARPALAGVLEQFHGDSIRAAIKEAAAIVPARAKTAARDVAIEALFRSRDPIADGDLAISGAGFRMGGDVADGLDKSAADADDRLRIRDSRDDRDVSSAVPEDGEEQLENPSRTGIFEVLTAAGVYEKCLVVTAPRTAGAASKRLLIVRLSDKAYGLYTPANVWAKVAADDPSAWDDLLADLPAAGEPASDPDETAVSRESRPATVFLGPNPHRDATAPARTTGVVGGPAGSSFRVYFDDARDDGGWPLADDSRRSFDHCSPTTDHLIVGWDGGERMRAAEGTLLVPPGFKSLRVHRPAHDDRILMPGHPGLRLARIRKAGRAMEVRASRGMYVVDGAPLDPDAAVVHLVARVGLREKAAREVLARADVDAAKTTRPTRFIVKAANPYLSSRDTPAPPIPDPWSESFPTLSGSVPGTVYQEEEIPVDSMRATPDELRGYDPLEPPEDAVRAVGRAAATGRRELVDTTVIGSILATMSPDLQVDRHLGPMFSGCDAVGRVLMSYYWHKKQFGDRYGESDLASLEDQLRNVFDAQGKLILVLKQKAVRAPFDTQRDLDLDVSDY